MDAREFEKKLKRCNPRLRVFKSAYKAWSISIREWHSDPETGHVSEYRHLCGMPSGQKFFGTLPKHDFWEVSKIGKKEYHRGWLKVVKMLEGMGKIRRWDALREFSLVSL